MKIAQIISEVRIISSLPDEMNAILKSSGYTYINSGVEHSVWRGPDGFVYKIMPPRYLSSEVAKQLHFGFADPTDVYLTRPQRCFIDFVEYCQKNKSNKFLPYFDDWSVHVRKTSSSADNKPKYYAYIQARTEALFPLKGAYSDWGRIYSSFAYWPLHTRQSVEHGDYTVSQLAAVSHLGSRSDIKKFMATIEELTAIAKKKNYTLDLHEGNFMFGSDGHVVINDPFYIPYTAAEKPPTAPSSMSINTSNTTA